MNYGEERVNEYISSLDDRRDEQHQNYNIQNDLSDDDETGSNLSEISNESAYFESKLSYQRRALLRKNFMLQWRQKVTNIF